MSPNITGPDVSPAIPISGPRTLHRQSTGSVHAANFATSSRSSSSSLLDDPRRGSAIVQGLPHAFIHLDARHYRTPDFADKLLEIFDVLRVPSWYKSTTTPNAIKIHKVSGSLTNAVFFVSLPSHSSRTLLLRIYGSSSGSLISRPRELHTLHVLSSTYGMGPRVYGTFENGRVEEYFDSVTLTADDIRVPRNSRHIGARMAELHGVDIAAIEGSTQSGQGTAKDWHIGAQKNVTSWLSPARKVLSLPVLPDEVRRELDLDVFQEKWERYMKWVKVLEKAEGASKRVFCHNDAQYGNLLKLKQLPDGTPEHREIIVVDFEYASPNPAAFDITNHFHEWTFNYHGPTPHLLDPTRYPSPEQRRNFYTAYLSHVQPPLPTSSTSPFLSLSEGEKQKELSKLELHVKAWSPASHAMWAVWGLVQAREDLEGGVQEPEFDYISYSRCRMQAFYREVAELGI